MSTELKPVQVRLSDEAHAALRLIAEIEDKDMGEKARELLTRLLLGEVHAVRLHVARMVRATAGENLREGAVERGNAARR